MRIPLSFLCIGGTLAVFWLKATAESYLDSNDIEDAIDNYLKKTNQVAKKNLLPTNTELYGKLKAVDEDTKGKLFAFEDTVIAAKRTPSKKQAVVESHIDDPSLDGNCSHSLYRLLTFSIFSCRDCGLEYA